MHPHPCSSLLNSEVQFPYVPTSELRFLCVPNSEVCFLCVTISEICAVSQRCSSYVFLFRGTVPMCSYIQGTVPLHCHLWDLVPMCSYSEVWFPCVLTSEILVLCDPISEVWFTCVPTSAIIILLISFNFHHCPHHTNSAAVHTVYVRNFVSQQRAAFFLASFKNKQPDPSQGCLAPLQIVCLAMTLSPLLINNFYPRLGLGSISNFHSIAIYVPTEI